MIKTFQRSWQLTKLTFRVIGQDKEMLLFPLVGGVCSLALAAALLFPTVVTSLTAPGAGAGAPGASTLSAMDYVVLVATYFALAFIATFFNVCVVHTARTRFEGGNATFGDSIRVAWSKVSLIAMWSLVAATVGLLLRALDALAERLGGAGELVMSILTSLLGLAWSVIVLFVVPGMVYRDLGPIAAIKSAVTTLRRTWGETAVRHFGLGLMQFLFLALGAGLGFVLVTLLGSLGTAGVITALAITAVYILGVILVFNVANSVFATALYAYANGYALPADFDTDTLSQAFRPRRRGLM